MARLKCIHACALRRACESCNLTRQWRDCCMGEHFRVTWSLAAPNRNSPACKYAKTGRRGSVTFGFRVWGTYTDTIRVSNYMLTVGGRYDVQKRECGEAVSTGRKRTTNVNPCLFITKTQSNSDSRGQQDTFAKFQDRKRTHKKTLTIEVETVFRRFCEIQSCPHLSRPLATHAWRAWQRLCIKPTRKLGMREAPCVWQLLNWVTREEDMQRLHDADRIQENDVNPT